MDSVAEPDSWTDSRVWDLLEHASERHGHATALALDDETYTYEELHRAVEGFARGLWREGLRPGERIGVLVGDVPEAIVTILAGAALGCPPVLLSTRNTSHELGYLLEAAAVTTVVVQTDSEAGALLDRHASVFGLDSVDGGENVAVESIDRVIAIGETSLTTRFDAVVAEGASAIDGVSDAMAAVRPEDTALLLFTSGTTSKPKAVVRTHRNLVPHAVDAARWYGVTEGERLLNAYPISSAAGVMRALMAISRGATSVLQGSYGVDRTMSLLADGGIAYLSGPDTVFRDLLEHDDLAAIDTESLRRVFVSMGGGLDVEFGARVEEAFRTPVENAYGLTEANPLVLRTRADDPFDARVRPGGNPGYGTEVRLDGTDSDRGEICLRGVSVTPGYENNPEANAAAFDEEGWFHTSDTGVAASFDDESFTFFAHRADAMFQVGSFNVSPQEVETRLMDHSAVVWTGVTSIEHERLGRVPAAAVAVSDDRVTADALTSFCAERLAGYKVPRTIFFVDESEIPYVEGHHGRKLDRDTLQSLVESKRSAV